MPRSVKIVLSGLAGIIAIATFMFGLYWLGILWVHSLLPVRSEFWFVALSPVGLGVVLGGFFLGNIVRRVCENPHIH